MTKIKKSVEEVKERIFNLSKELSEHEGSKAHGIRKQIEILHWVIGE